MAKVILVESAEILKQLSFDQLKMFAKMRRDPKIWEPYNAYVKMQKDDKLDKIYRLRRPRTQDEMTRNAIEHEYYAARVSSLVIELQLMENADAELERRAKKEK